MSTYIHTIITNAGKPDSKMVEFASPLFCLNAKTFRRVSSSQFSGALEIINFVIVPELNSQKIQKDFDFYISPIEFYIRKGDIVNWSITEVEKPWP